MISPYLLFVLGILVGIGISVGAVIYVQYLDTIKTDIANIREQIKNLGRDYVDANERHHKLKIDMENQNTSLQHALVLLEKDILDRFTKLMTVVHHETPVENEPEDRNT